MRSGWTPGKQRTRQHVIADQSVNYVERFVIDEGHMAQRQTPDYGYDLNLITCDSQGYVEPGTVYLQLKAAETLQQAGADFVFDPDIRDYNLWTREIMPVVLVLFDAARRRAYWLHVQGYFQQDPSRRPKKTAKTVRVRVTRRQAVNRRAVAKMRELKQATFELLNGVMNDD